jgi:hypothetical protein
MSVDKKDMLQALGSKIEYISAQLSENDSDFNDCKDSLNQASSKFGNPQLGYLASQLQQLRLMNQQTSMNVEAIANLVRQLSAE